MGDVFQIPCQGLCVHLYVERKEKRRKDIAGRWKFICDVKITDSQFTTSSAVLRDKLSCFVLVWFGQVCLQFEMPLLTIFFLSCRAFTVGPVNGVAYAMSSPSATTGGGLGSSPVSTYFLL